MTFTFNTTFDIIFEKLEYELKPHKEVYIKILSLSRYTTLSNNVKYRNIDFSIVYKPKFEPIDERMFTLTIWYNPAEKNYWIYLKKQINATIIMITSYFKEKDYSKIMKLLNKYKKRKTIEI